MSRRDPDREDFRSDDLGSNDRPYEEPESWEPGYDPGPEEDDEPEDEEGIRQKLDRLYDIRSEIENKMTDLHTRSEKFDKQIEDLEAKLDALEE